MCVLRNDVIERLENGWPVEDILREIEDAGFVPREVYYIINEAELCFTRATKATSDTNQIDQLGGI